MRCTSCTSFTESRCEHCHEGSAFVLDRSKKSNKNHHFLERLDEINNSFVDVKEELHTIDIFS